MIARYDAIWNVAYQWRHHGRDAAEGEARQYGFDFDELMNAAHTYNEEITEKYRDCH